MTEQQVKMYLGALSIRIEQESTTWHPPGYQTKISFKVIEMCRNEALVITAPYIPMCHEEWFANPDITRLLETIKQQTKDMFDERRV